MKVTKTHIYWGLGIVAAGAVLYLATKKKEPAKKLSASGDGYYGAGGFFSNLWDRIRGRAEEVVGGRRKRNYYTVNKTGGSGYISQSNGAVYIQLPDGSQYHIPDPTTFQQLTGMTMQQYGAIPQMPAGASFVPASVPFGDGALINDGSGNIYLIKGDDAMSNLVAWHVPDPTTFQQLTGQTLAAWQAQFGTIPAVPIIGQYYTMDQATAPDDVDLTNMPLAVQDPLAPPTPGYQQGYNQYPQYPQYQPGVGYGGQFGYPQPGYGPQGYGGGFSAGYGPQYQNLGYTQPQQYGEYNGPLIENQGQDRVNQFGQVNPNYTGAYANPYQAPAPAALPSLTNQGGYVVSGTRLSVPNTPTTSTPYRGTVPMNHPLMRDSGMMSSNTSQRLV